MMGDLLLLLALRSLNNQKQVELDKIRNGDQHQIEDIYNRHKSEFTSWIIKLYHCPHEDAGEIYHYSVIAFYKNVISNKLKVLDCSIKTYLFAIGHIPTMPLAGRKAVSE